MKGGITRRLDEVLKSLDEKQLKRALYLTENDAKLERQHQYIEEAARTCLANKDNKKVCEEAIKMARNRVNETVSLPLDDTSLEGLEQYLTTNVPVSEPEVKQQTPIQQIQAPPSGFLAKAQKTDEELYENCPECHIAVAASRFADICAENPEEAGSCELIGQSLENENTEPVDWLKAMIQTAEESQGKAKEEMAGALTECTDYLRRRDSPFLKALEKEVENAETTIIPAYTENPES